jgi:hypothetical protein
MFKWFGTPMDVRAPHGGEEGLNGRWYKGGEILPFYVPRPIMPQIDEQDFDEFIAFAKSRGADVRLTTFDPLDLHAHQRIDPIKLARMPDSVRAKPIFVSLDLYILDGNHRWAMHLMTHSQDVPALQLNLRFADAIQLMFNFPKTYALENSAERN